MPRTDKVAENRRRRQDLGIEELPLRDERTAHEVHRDVQSDIGEIKVLTEIARRTATESTQRTERMLKVTTEARDTGIETARELERQTKQLEKIDDDIEEVHDIIDRGEKTVNKMTRRWFSGSSRAKNKVNKKDANRITELKGDGIESLDLPSDDEGKTNDRDQLFMDKNGIQGGKNGGKHRAPRPKRAGPDAALHEELDQAEDQQDEHLDQMSIMLKEMKGLAGAMDKELQYQTHLVDKVQTGTREVSGRIQSNNQKLKKFTR
mmetsp:Transcript_11139/g.34130  ORF Transcript_11139/g.34130 Transcript_11139/m.34130 type:complete len:264 (+) Transcript_11139:160-951(+)|eukprot:CAMPEP_0198730154 /NCGR_PEP_ID=MMETSP1475-20131203/23095_1 /TAXON_ID= ORGANISM="Unidentified sp., Strain CCMP1999" /NCGR_SAMPLE_ID=MMETSP1475 /ASSEMBLY_ACC=CAM_ASM_001111 /LENGTH=263 /DNA_ID=CAMNT_0044492925 /DNA_START=111 /DNA_END=902 /DNA_ORIENTATION=+